MKYNPYTVNRKVRIQDTTPDGIAVFTTKSMTDSDPEDRCHPCVDLVTGSVTCDCPDFRHRHAKHDPTTATPDHLCKHLSRAVQNLKRRGAAGDAITERMLAASPFSKPVRIEPHQEEC